MGSQRSSARVDVAWRLWPRDVFREIVLVHARCSVVEYRSIWGRIDGSQPRRWTARVHAVVRKRHRIAWLTQLVGGACDSARMNGADAFDILAEISGRRLKRAIGTAFIVGVLAFPGPTVGMFNWYVAQRAQDLVQQFEHALRTTPPSEPSGPHPAAP
jgi:hypothetical protein